MTFFWKEDPRLFESSRNRKRGRAFARKGTTAVTTVLLSAVLGACGGGGGDDSAATGATAAPSHPAAVIGANVGNGGAAGEAGTTGGNGATVDTDGNGPPVAGESAGGSGGGLTAVPAAAKGSTTLSWQPPTAYDDGTPLKVTGYRIYWGPSEGHYPHSVTLDNPGLTRYVVEELAPATWYFVATALSADGESPPSNVIVMEVL